MGAISAPSNPVSAANRMFNRLAILAGLVMLLCYGTAQAGTSSEQAGPSTAQAGTSAGQKSTGYSVNMTITNYSTSAGGAWIWVTGNTTGLCGPATSVAVSINLGTTNYNATNALLLAAYLSGKTLKGIVLASCQGNNIVIDGASI